MSWLHHFNALLPEDAAAEVRACCGSTAWAAEVVRRRPYADADALLRAADQAWWALGPEHWHEAFRAHPRIGERKAQAEQGARAAAWSASEQSGVDGAGEDVAEALARGNREYEQRFGHIYLVCATGKSAGEMLEILRSRLGNGADEELRIAAGEQAKITRLRLERLLNE